MMYDLVVHREIEVIRGKFALRWDDLSCMLMLMHVLEVSICPHSTTEADTPRAIFT